MCTFLFTTTLFDECYFKEKLVQHGIKLHHFNLFILSTYSYVPLRHNCSNFERQKPFHFSYVFQNRFRINRAHLELFFAKINYLQFEKVFIPPAALRTHCVDFRSKLHWQHTNSIFGKLTVDGCEYHATHLVLFCCNVEQSTITDRIIA